MLAGMNFNNMYGVGSGFAPMNQQEELAKALTVGDGRGPQSNPPVAGEGFALLRESLEGTLRTTAFTMSHLKLYKQLTSLPARQVREQYNLLRAYGQEGVPGFYSEGGLPNVSDSTYERKDVTIRMMGVTRHVSGLAMASETAHGDLIDNETINGTIDLLGMKELALFRADSSVNPLEFDGLDVQITNGAPSAVIDLRGQPLTEDALTDGARQVADRPNYGRPTDLHTSPTAINDFVKQFYPRQRMDLPDPASGMVGGTVMGMMTQAGPVRFQSNVNVHDGGAAGAAAGNPALRPTAPIQAVAPAASGSASPLWTTKDAGTYTYQAVATNGSGRSDPLTLTPVVVAATNTVTFTLQAPLGRQVTGYEIYRTNAGGAASSARLIARVPATAGGLTVITDVNAKLPGTTDAYLIQSDTQNLAIKQLMGMVRQPLAKLDDSIRWMQNAYFALVVYTPQKNIIFRNVGRPSGAL